ncbi:MAG: MFS transporter [Sphingopyxis sp.]
MTGDDEGQTTQSSDRAAREAHFAAQVETNLRRNMIANFTHGMLGMTGFRIIHAPTLIPAYLQLISGSPLIVGLGQSLLQLGLISSPLASATRLEHRVRILPAAIAYGTMMRLAVLGLAVAGYVLDGTALVGMTMLFLLMLGVFNGMQRVAFQMVISKLIPTNRRGRLQGWRNLLGGLVAAALSYVAGKWLIDGNMWGNGYATTFFFAFLLTSLGLLALKHGVVEPDAPAVRPRVTMRERMRDIPALLADRDYRWFVIAQGAAMAGRIAAPFYILIASRHMPLIGSTIGLLSLAFLGADTLSNLLWGHWGDRVGYRATFLLALSCLLGGLALLAVGGSTTTIVAAFCAFGVGTAGYQMSAQTMVLEFGSREDLPMRIALSTMVEGGVSALAPLIGGAILYWLGVNALLVGAAVLTGAALIIMAMRVVDPRRRVTPACPD